MKPSEIEKILEQLDQSVMFKKLICTIKKHWQSQPSENKLSHHHSQAVDDQIGEIISQNNQTSMSQDGQSQDNTLKPQIIYQDKIVEKRIEVPVEKIVEKRVEIPIEKIIEKKIEVVPKWAINLEEQYHYFQQLAHYPELKSILVSANTDIHTELLSFISCSAQWQNIIRVWDKLAEQCKQSQQSIDTERLSILENSLFLYNLTLANHQASLKKPHIHDEYDFSIHMQIAGSGSKIHTVLLPALYNATGEKVKPALVITA